MDAADDRVFVNILDSSVKVDQFVRPVVTDGRDLVCQVWDAVAAALCKPAPVDVRGLRCLGPAKG